MRKWLWILLFLLAAQAAGEGMAGQQYRLDAQPSG